MVYPRFAWSRRTAQLGAVLTRASVHYPSAAGRQGVA
jgi:hypothetical protein